MGVESPGPPARHRNGAAGRSVERARGRVWSSLGTTMRIEQDVTEKVMMEGQLGKPRSHVQILELPPLLGIDIGNGLKTNEPRRGKVSQVLVVRTKKQISNQWNDRRNNDKYDHGPGGSPAPRRGARLVVLGGLGHVSLVPAESRARCIQCQNT